MNNPKFPKIHVKLTSMEGNAFTIIGSVMHAMRFSGCCSADIEAFRERAMSGSYEHLLQTVGEYVTIT